jgi:hypothetical protein
MADTNKSEIVETVPAKQIVDQAAEKAEYTKLIVSIKKSKEKITRDIKVEDSRELVIRNTAELVAVRAIRDKKNSGKIKKTQSVLNKFKKLV